MGLDGESATLHAAHSVGKTRSNKPEAKSIMSGQVVRAVSKTVDAGLIPRPGKAWTI